MDPFVDAIFGRLKPGKLYMHAAPIGMGKTTLAMQTCLSYALRSDGPISYYFDWEHNSQLLSWIASYSARIGRLDFLKREPNSMAHLEAITPQINRSLKIADFVLDTTLADLFPKGGNAIRELVDQDQQLSEYPGVRLIVVDGLGAMTEATGWLPSRDSLSESVAQLRKLAVDQECPVYATHQLNARENDVAEGLPPDPAATSNCRNLLQECDIGVASGKLDRNNHRRTVFRFFGYESVGGRDDVPAYLSKDVAEWRLQPDVVASHSNGDLYGSSVAGSLQQMRAETEHSNEKEGSRERESPIDFSKPAELKPRTLYHAFCDGQRTKEVNGLWLAKLIIPDVGYVWQAMPCKPKTGLWIISTHELLLCPTAQVRSFPAINYDPGKSLIQSHLYKDHKVLFASCTTSEPLSKRAMSRIVAKGRSYHSISQSIGRLLEAGLLVRDGCERVSANWPNAEGLKPVFPNHPSHKQCDQRISRFVGQHYRRTGKGVSEYAIRQAIPIGHARLSSRLKALRQRGRLQHFDGVYLPKAMAGNAEFPASHFEPHWVAGDSHER